MQDRSPRTVSEFAAHGRRVVVGCYAYGTRRVVPPDVLSMVFGSDFDCVGSLFELKRELRCECCGERNRQIEFADMRDLERADRQRAEGHAPTGTR